MREIRRHRRSQDFRPARSTQRHSLGWKKIRSRCVGRGSELLGLPLTLRQEIVKFVESTFLLQLFKLTFLC